jgi:hypothetical protein
LFSSLWFLPYIILEALSLHLYKTTPGKFLLGLRVVTAAEQPLPVGSALLRCLRVYIFGMGVFFWPLLLPVICHALCCWYTFRNGEAPWDAIQGNKVRMAGLFLFPLLLFVMLFMIVLILWALLLLPALFEYMEMQGGSPRPG